MMNGHTTSRLDHVGSSSCACHGAVDIVTGGSKLLTGIYPQISNRSTEVFDA